jgi:hypothetical protein
MMLKTERPDYKVKYKTKEGSLTAAYFDDYMEAMDHYERFKDSMLLIWSGTKWTALLCQVNGKATLW